MQTKLTLRIEEDLIDRAKLWARRRGVSLSQVVASVLAQLPSSGRRPSSLSPWTRQLIGIAAPTKARPRTDAAVRKAYLDHLAGRHR
jgi:hypothetical protein